VNTLLLSADWDLTLDNAGNLAVARGGYAIAQDCASAVRLWRGELWYATNLGVVYANQIFGAYPIPSASFLKAQFVGACLTVSGVVSVACFLTGPGFNRVVGGQLQITDNLGRLNVIESVSVLQKGVLPWYVTAVNISGVGINYVTNLGTIVTNAGVPVVVG
jgi:hypothetical protein